MHCVRGWLRDNTRQLFRHNYVQFSVSFYQGGGGQNRVLEMLRRGGINHQAVWQNKVKIQGGGEMKP